MRPVVVSVGPLASPSANNIALSQTPAAAGALTLNGSLVSGGVATLDTARRVLFTTASNESAKTITVTGTNWQGNTVSETLTGPNATTGYTVLDYATVTSITVSAAFTGAVTVGTNAVASSGWVRLDSWAPNFTSVICTITGSPNYTVQGSADDPNSAFTPVAPASMVWVSCPDTTLVAATTSINGGYTYSPIWVRVLLNSGTAAGVTATFTQFSNGPR